MNQFKYNPKYIRYAVWVLAIIGFAIIGYRQYSSMQGPGPDRLSAIGGYNYSQDAETYHIHSFGPRLDDLKLFIIGYGNLELPAVNANYHAVTNDELNGQKNGLYIDNQRFNPKGYTYPIVFVLSGADDGTITTHPTNYQLTDEERSILSKPRDHDKEKLHATIKNVHEKASQQKTK